MLTEAAKRETILIVDDSVDSRLLLGAFLKKEGFLLREATDGTGVAALCAKNPPDLILLDIVMPNKDGYETCRELKNHPVTESIPVIFLSAKDDTVDKVRGLDLGAVDYITKPFDKAEVVARVRTQLKIHHLTRELVQSNRLLQEKQVKIEEDLQAAAQIHASLIPAARPDVPEFSFSWQFIPSDQSGGDIFNIHLLDDRTMAVYILDVSGHGVPAAMVTVSVAQSLQPHGDTIMRKKGLDTSGPTARHPSEVLDILNRDYPIDRFDKYFTIIYAIIDRFTGEMIYSNAGHPVPFLLRTSGTIELLDAGGPLIGLGDLLPFDEGTKKLERGDRLFLHTDGITEYGGEEEFFGSERLKAELVRTRDLPLDLACERIIDAMRVFGGGIGADDDITLVALEFKG